MNFGEAIERLRQQDRVRRFCWPAGQWIAHSPQSLFPKKNITRNANWILSNRDLIVAEAIGLYEPGGIWHMSWIPTAQDLFAYDWEVFPPNSGSVNLIKGQ